jgi:hypothetical protein
LRVLVAIEEDYRAYREVVAAGIRALRPGAQVATAALSDLESEMALFAPQVVITSRPSAAEPRYEGTTWIELPTDPSRPAVVSFDGRNFVQRNLTLDVLLQIVDEAWLGPKKNVG